MCGNLSAFRIDTYVDFLDFLNERYQIIPFCRFSGNTRSFLILRHDVHMSLGSALEMARVEKKRGIRSTYFVYVSNKYYNLSSSDDLAVVKEICDMGHEIGLHYDLEEYRNYHSSLKSTLLSEIARLEKLTRRRIRSIAMHNRSLYKVDPFANIPGYLNAYSLNKDFDIQYVSDSCRAWRIEDAHRLITEKPEKVQLLIHPSHWIPTAADRYFVLDKLYSAIDHQNHRLREQWKAFWRRVPYVKKYDRDVKIMRPLLDFTYDPHWSKRMVTRSS